jgi:hypothetical protein
MAFLVLLLTLSEVVQLQRLLERFKRSCLLITAKMAALQNVEYLVGLGVSAPLGEYISISQERGGLLDQGALERRQRVQAAILRGKLQHLQTA